MHAQSLRPARLVGRVIVPKGTVAETVPDCQEHAKSVALEV